MGAILPDLLLLNIELLFLILPLLNFGLKTLTLTTKFFLLLISIHSLEDCLLIFHLLILKWLEDLVFTLEILILKNPWIFEFSFLKLHGLKKFLRLMELILWYAINVIQLLPSLKFFIALMVSYFPKIHLHKLKTSFFLKPYLTHMVFCNFLKSFISIFNISNFYFFAYTYLNFYFIFLYFPQL